MFYTSRGGQTRMLGLCPDRLPGNCNLLTGTPSPRL